MGAACARDEERKRCAESTARPQRHELQERVASRPNNPLRATSSTRTSLWFDGGSAGSSCSLSKRLSGLRTAGAGRPQFWLNQAVQARDAVAFGPLPALELESRDARVMHASPREQTDRNGKTLQIAGFSVSRPLSRILLTVTIHLGRRFPGGSSGAPGSSAGHLVAEPASPCTGRGLASRRVATTLVGSYPTFSPLPPSVSGDPLEGGLLSVPLSVGFRRLGFPQRPALRCPDFPRAPEGPRSPGLRGEL
jgi:hypothetical protein